MDRVCLPRLRTYFERTARLTRRIEWPTVLYEYMFDKIIEVGIYNLQQCYIVSVHRMVMENRPVDPGSIQGSHRPISFIRIKQNTRERYFV